jgi:hypothetical protein
MKLFRESRLFWVVFLPVFFVIGLIVFSGSVDAATQDEGIDRGLLDRTLDPSISNEKLRSADKFWDEMDKFILIGDLQAFATYSKLESDEADDDDWGGSFLGLIAPAYKFGERMMFIGMYDGQYTERLELYSDDYGNRGRTGYQRHAFTPMLRIDFGEDSRYSITPSIFYTATWNKDEGQEDDWDKGLYNYRDEGIGLDFDMREAFGEYGIFRAGMQYYDRRYPNYQNLLYEWNGVIGDDPTDTYKDEKDYRGIIAMLGYNWIKDSGFSWAIDYSLLYKKFDDKKVLNSNGIVDQSEKQEDYVHELVLGSWYSFDDIAGGLNLGLDFVFRIYDSNENFLYYNGLSWAVNDNYFDYTSYRIIPNATYIFEQIPLTATVSYSYKKVDYSDRWALNSKGGIKNDEQWETLHQILVGMTFQLAEKWSVLAQYEYLNGHSNNDYVAVYVYDYELSNFLIGFKYEF